MAADALVGNYAIIALHAPFCYLLGITTMELVKGGGQSLGATMRRNVGPTPCSTTH